MLFGIIIVSFLISEGRRLVIDVSEKIIRDELMMVIRNFHFFLEA